MDESTAGDGNKRKASGKLSGSSRRKLAKEASLKADARKCIKLTAFMTKLPIVNSDEVSAENERVSDDRVLTTCSFQYSAYGD